ncbi:MAG: (2Fe-2S)-binding protein, partial [Planctomycetota bacterium]
GFRGGAGGGAAARALGTSLEAETRTLAATQSERLTGELEIELTINGTQQRLTVEPRTTLLDALRWRMQTPLTGTKEVCDRAACGACTVIVDGRTAYACTQLAVDFLGREITTVEGLGQPDNLSPVQQAFCEKDALMCGFCTPGFVVSVTNTLERQPAADLGAIRAGCAGNVCRCGTYPHIFEAALAARDAKGKTSGGAGR